MAHADLNPLTAKHRTAYVQETAGFDRVGEPVDTEIKFFQPMPSKDKTGIGDIVTKGIRVFRVTSTDDWEEIMFQAYDIRPYHWNRRSETPELMVRVRIAFFATVAANMTETYHICYAAPDSKSSRNESGLKVSGEGVGYTIENPYFRMITDKTSGQIDKIDLKFAGNPSFSFRSGNMHWNPDFMYVPEDFPTTWFKWYYAHDFENPPREIESGPIFFSMKRSQVVPGLDIAWMEVSYLFFDGLPYFIMESTIEVRKKCLTLAIRNDELAFGSDDFTHAGWRNHTSDMIDGHIGELGSVDIYNAARSGNHVLGSALPPNIAWISMIHNERGYGAGSIRLDWKNVNVLTGAPSPIYNSHTVISEHGSGLYWFRSLVYSQRDDYNNLGWNADDWRNSCVEIPKGSSYYEKNAYVFFEWDVETKFKPIDDLWFKLKNPLLVTVVQ